VSAIAPNPAALLRLSARLALDDGTCVTREAESEREKVWLGDERHGVAARNYLLEMAAAHGMRPLLYRFLCGAEDVRQTSVCRGFPESDDYGVGDKLKFVGHLTSILQEFTRQNLRKNMRMTGEMILLLRLLAGQGVNVIPFKGPTLAALAYGDLGQREFGDLDLLIGKRDFMKAQESLIASGYQPEVLLNAKQSAVFTEACNVMAFWHSEKEISVELHWELSPKYLPFSPDPGRLWERMVRSHPGGQTVMTLSPEDLLVYLCAHGAKHIWEKLIWIVDVAGLIRRHPNLDWDRVCELSAEQRCERILFLGLRLARDVTGASAPPEIEKHMESDSESGRLAAKVIERLFSDSGAQRASVAEGLFIFSLQRRWQDKIRSFMRMAITPSAADWLSFPNLRQFVWMYPLLRPLRLLGKLAPRR
jgi:hypothetical protein